MIRFKVEPFLGKILLEISLRLFLKPSHTMLEDMKNQNFEKYKVRSNFNEQILKFRAENRQI